MKSYISGGESYVDQSGMANKADVITPKSSAVFFFTLVWLLMTLTFTFLTDMFLDHMMNQVKQMVT